MIKVTICKFAELDPDLGSSAIMAVTEDDGSHVGTVRGNELTHAIEKGVVKDDFIEFMKTHKVVDSEELILNCTEEEYERHFQMYKGRRYGFIQSIGHLIPLKFVQKWLSNGRRKMMCYEWCAAQAQDLGGLWELADMAEWLNQKTLLPKIREIKAKRLAQTS